jgi:acyl transferase domain-containing protein
VLDPILDEFRAGVRKMKLSPPTRRFISNLTGTWADAKEVTTAEYWVRHLRHCVRFADGMATLLAERNRVFLEVGPGTTLCSLTRMQKAKNATHEVVACLRHPQENVDDVQFLLTALGRLWCVGKNPDWSKLRGPAKRQRLSLPTYAFDHQRYWIDAPKRGLAGLHSDTSLTRVADLRDWFHKPVWRPAVLPPGVAAPRTRFVLFLDDDGPGEPLAQRLLNAGHEVVRVVRGPSFQSLGKLHYALNPAERSDYEALLEELRAGGFVAEHFVHLWLARGGKRNPSADKALEEAKVLGFYSLLFLAQALGQSDPEAPVRLTVVTDGAQQVFDEALPHPEFALVLGPVQVVPREVAMVRTRWVDVQIPAQRWKRRFDPRPADAAAMLTQLVAELTSVVDDRQVALRSLGRFVQHTELVAVPEPTQKLPVVDGGAYVITGGLGGIGLACARWLAQQAKISLVLLSRTGLPPRSDWDDYRASGTVDGVGRTVQAVLDLEATGAKVVVLRADVGDGARLAAAIAEAVATTGPIRGVIHAAGVVDDQLLSLKHAERAERVLAPKVRGTLNLDAALAGQPLEFFVAFSSTSTALGLPGQIDYVAANAFLNAFATARRRADGPLYVALGWGVWADVGMAAQAVNAGQPVGSRDSGHPWLGQIVCGHAALHALRRALRQRCDLAARRASHQGRTRAGARHRLSRTGARGFAQRRREPVGRDSRPDVHRAARGRRRPVGRRALRSAAQRWRVRLHRREPRHRRGRLARVCSRCAGVRLRPSAGDARRGGDPRALSARPCGVRRLRTGDQAGAAPRLRPALEGLAPGRLRRPRGARDARTRARARQRRRRDPAAPGAARPRLPRPACRCSTGYATCDDLFVPMAVKQARVFGGCRRGS